MELVQLGEKTYYIKNATNIGIYKIDEKNVYLIDTGNDKDAGKKILKILNEQGWTCKGVILTHSHADHMGGAKLIQDRTNCQVLAHNIETCFAKYPVLEPSLLYGAYPLKDLQNKFLMAKETNTLEVEDNLPEGLEILTLKGHTFDMIGIKTSDNIYFLGDALLSEETITKYHLFYLYNVKEFLNTLEYLSTLNGHFYIPSHIEGTSNIKDLITLNRNKVQEICQSIYNICQQEQTMENILTEIFKKYNLKMNLNQYVLIGSTLKAYVTYLYEEEKLTYKITENKILWIQKEKME
mgnify:CR=1 FL=1